MKTFKRMLAVVIMLAMMVPMLAFGASADDNVDTYWTTVCGKYSSSSDRIIAPKNVIKTEGFTFTENEDGGIDVHMPDYATFSGVAATAAVASKYQVALDGLNVHVTLAEDTAFRANDTGVQYGNFSMLWSDEQITALADPQNQKGLCWGSQSAVSNGLRQIGTDTKKGLCLVAMGGYAPLNGTKVASMAYVIMFDGTFKDVVDGREGYRWSFVARNHPETANGDSTGISRPYERIDLSEGLEFTVRSDTTLGYVAAINGTEYYKGSEVGYFPNNTYGSGGGGSMTEEDIINKSQAYLDSMTYKREDIDLSALKTVSQGYVTVGATAACQDPRFDFTVDTINGDPAATFGLVHDWSDWEVVKEPSCAPGEKTRTCSLCNRVQKQTIAPVAEHDWGDWEVTKEPTVAEEGEESRTCKVCETVETRPIDKIANPFIDVPASSWYTMGVIYCYNNGYMNGTSGNTFGPTVTMNRAMFATILAKIDNADLTDYPGTIESSFSDVPSGKWFTGTIEWAYKNDFASGIGNGMFGPNNPVTRETLAQFLYNYSQKKGIELEEGADISGYPDADKVSGWAVNAVKWAIKVGLISGVKVGDEVYIKPKDEASRAQVALIVKNYVENVVNGK